MPPGYRRCFKSNWKYFLPARWLLQIIKSTTKPFYCGSKNLLSVSGQIGVYLQIRDRNTITLFSVVFKLAIEVLLATRFIDKHTLAVLPENRKVAVRNSNTVAITEQKNWTANAVLNYRDTEDLTNVIFPRQSAILKMTKTSPLLSESPSNYCTTHYS